MTLVREYVKVNECYGLWSYLPGSIPFSFLHTMRISKLNENVDEEDSNVPKKNSFSFKMRKKDRERG